MPVLKVGKKPPSVVRLLAALDPCSNARTTQTNVNNRNNKLKLRKQMKLKSKIKNHSCLLMCAAPLLLAGIDAQGGAKTVLNGASPRPFYVIAHNPNTLESATNA